LLGDDPLLCPFINGSGLTRVSSLRADLRFAGFAAGDADEAGGAGGGLRTSNLELNFRRHLVQTEASISVTLPHLGQTLCRSALKNIPD
jgi:hypothetical protein